MHVHTMSAHCVSQALKVPASWLRGGYQNYSRPPTGNWFWRLGGGGNEALWIKRFIYDRCRLDSNPEMILNNHWTPARDCTGLSSNQSCSLVPARIYTSQTCAFSPASSRDPTCPDGTPSQQGGRSEWLCSREQLLAQHQEFCTPYNHDMMMPTHAYKPRLHVVKRLWLERLVSFCRYPQCKYGTQVHRCMTHICNHTLEYALLRCCNILSSVNQVFI